MQPAKSYSPNIERATTFCISHHEVERLARRSDRQGAKLIGDCEELIEVRNQIGDETSFEIWRKEMETLRRRELGYRRWHTQIYMPMSDRLLRKVSPEWLSEQHKMRREHGEQYVRHLNDRGHVFLDTETSALYCGHAELPGAITRLVNSPIRDRMSKRDHTMSVAIQRTDEEQALMTCQTPALRQVSHDDIDQILRPGSKDFRVKDSRDWQRYIDRDICHRPRNRSAKQLESSFRIGHEEAPPRLEQRSETFA